MITNFDFLNDTVRCGPVTLPRHLFFVAEIGINHNGDMKLAKDMISMAKAAGCDAVKFQKRTIDLVYTPELLAQPRESPWGTTQRDQKEGLEFSEAEYDQIDRFCRETDISWFASAWDIPSQKFLRKYDLPFNKIASALLTHPDFLRLVASECKPTFLSTGMADMAHLERAVQIFQDAGCPIILMHTVSTYPCPEKDLNLACMHTLRERFNLPVGYSGHESSVSPSLVAAAMGAVAIERHVTLDRAMYGSDQAASLEGQGLFQLLGQLRKLPTIIGDGAKTFGSGEQAVAKKLRYWE